MIYDAFVMDTEQRKAQQWGKVQHTWVVRCANCGKSVHGTGLGVTRQLIYLGWAHKKPLGWIHCKKDGAE